MTIETPRRDRGASLWSALTLVGAVLLAWLVWPSAGPEVAEPAATSPSPQKTTVESPTQAALPATAPVESTPPAADTPGPAAKPLGKVTMPDGSVIEAINGVTEDVTMVWDNVPYSPIVRKVFHNGWWWWEHADGAFTTVQMVPMNGVLTATPIYSKPTEVGTKPPLDDAEIMRLGGQRAQQQGTGK